MLEKILSPRWLDPDMISDQYRVANPFPHIVMEDFLDTDLLERVGREFPDLESLGDHKVEHKNSAETKYASKGMFPLSPSAFELVSKLNSDVFLQYLQSITGIEETLISDPYLAGGGYHEIKKGGFLKIHADFNKHPKMNLDRRLNLIIYLNKDWSDDWGGGLELFGSEMDSPIVTVIPDFNTAVLFTTTSATFHGHPDPLKCPQDRSRRSLALYYFSSTAEGETFPLEHPTLFKERPGETFAMSYKFRRLISGLIPLSFKSLVKKLLK
jgi:Rps23 Pro-64 3,4-dihydroxylase Tpa1-like proline 4-hydroxylase